MASVPAERSGRTRGCWLAALAALLGLAVVIGVALIAVLTIRASPADPEIDRDRVQQAISSRLPHLESQARAVLASAGTSGCAPQVGGAQPTVPTIPDLPNVRAWCTAETDPTKSQRSIVDVDGIDPSRRCPPGAAFAVFAVPEAEWGTPFVIHSEHCAPTSWSDGDPYYGRAFVPISGPWYAVRPLGAAIHTSW
jgi:hypothetical protein